MDKSTDWDEARKRHVNLARAESLQKALEEMGYFRRPWPWTPLPPTTHKEEIPIRAALVHLLVDYLHIADKEKQLVELPKLQDLVTEAYTLFEKEPRFRQGPP